MRDVHPDTPFAGERWVAAAALKSNPITPFGLISSYLEESGVRWPSSHADVIIAMLEAGGYLVIDTELLRAALDFGQGREPSPVTLFARANLWDRLPR